MYYNILALIHLHYFRSIFDIVTLNQLTLYLTAVGATLLEGIPRGAGEQTTAQKALLPRVLAVIKDPRSNQSEEERVVDQLYQILSLQMNQNLKCDRVKLFKAKDGSDAYGTATDRKNPIVGVNYRGKAQLHGCCVADCLTSAQEAWIVLHMARCYYFLFESNMTPEQCPVTPQSLAPGGGTSNSYSNKDVTYFRTIVKKIDKARKEEMKKLADGTMEKDERYCYWDFPEEAKKVAEEVAAGKKDSKAESKDDSEEVVAEEIDDDSIGADSIEEY